MFENVECQSCYYNLAGENWKYLRTWHILCRSVPGKAIAESAPHCKSGTTALLSAATYLGNRYQTPTNFKPSTSSSMAIK
jgi:hypothetical protein